MHNISRFCSLNKLCFQRGTATVEFSIMIIPLLLLLFGVTEYGRAIYQYNTLVKSVRDSTRYLSTVAPGSEHFDAKCLAVYGTLAAPGTSNCIGTIPLAPGLTTSMVSICDASITSCQATHQSQNTGSGTINLVTVTVSGYEFHSLINFPIGGVTVGAPDLTYGAIQSTMRQAS